MRLLRNFACLALLSAFAVAVLLAPAAIALLGFVAPALAAGPVQAPEIMALEPALEGSLVADLGALSTALLVAGVAILLATAIWLIDRTSRRQRGDLDDRNPRYRAGGLVHPFGPTGRGGHYDPS